MRQPLAFRLRPTTLDDIIGQKHLVGEGKIIRRCVEEKTIFSMIFFGPPGVGKTTMATVIANEVGIHYRLFNAVTGNKKDLDAIFAEAKLAGSLVVIVEEIHRLNKDKQDLLLPHVESGLVTMIGTTTSNPYFAINPAIRSRCHLFELRPLTEEDVVSALQRAVSREDIFNNIVLTDEAAHLIARYANGDMRYALNVLEISAIAIREGEITPKVVEDYLPVGNSSLDHDEGGHYDAVSAFQKSIRGSDVDAALYYLSRLMSANDMDSIERRLLVTAYEDIGLANPAAVARTINAIDAAKRVGFPEAVIPLGVAVIDLALSPKSKAGCLAVHAAMDEVQKHPLNPPEYLRLTPVGMKEEDKYPYDRPDIWHRIQYLPDEIKDISFYQPANTSSYERALAENLKELKKYARSAQLAKLKANKK